jgi:hypothetical protein
MLKKFFIIHYLRFIPTSTSEEEISILKYTGNLFEENGMDGKTIGLYVSGYSTVT